MSEEIIWKRDCKEFNSDYPCDVLAANDYKSCSECNFYNPYTKRILIIKLNQIGDVIRTTAILKDLHKKYKNPQITWLVEEISKPILTNNTLVDRVLVYDLTSVLRLRSEEFDILINLDISQPSTSLAGQIKAFEKLGYFADKYGHTSCFNKEAEYYLNCALSNKQKRENRKSVVEMFFETSCLEIEDKSYMLNVNPKTEKYIENFKYNRGIKEDEKIIGINIGSAERWPSKMLDVKSIVKLVKEIDSKTSFRPLILVGPLEKKLGKDKQIIKELNKENIQFYINDSDNTLDEFISIINLCELIVTGDTMSMHIGIAIKKKVIALFYCTPPWEIDSNENLIKISSPLLEKYLFSNEHIQELINSISIEEIFDNIKKISEKQNI